MGFNPIDRRINPFKPFYKIDANGFLLDLVGVEITPENPDPEPPEGFVHLPNPLNFHKPKWDGEQWVEGATQEELDAIEKERQKRRELARMKEPECRLKNLENAILTIMDLM